MAWLELDQFRMYYKFERRGTRPVLLLSNSLGTDHSLWRPQMEAFTAHFDVLRYDARGHGNSGVPSGPYSIETLGKDAVDLLDGLNLQRVHFCGLSMGGMVGQWLGMNAPERFERLILCNTAAKIGTVEGWNARIQMVRDHGMAAIVPTVIKNWYTERFREVSPEPVAETAAILLATDAEGYMASCAAVRDMDLRGDSKRIKAPTLVVFGEEDPVTPPETAFELAEGISSAQAFGLKASHLSNVEASDEFTRGVLTFLGVTEAANG